MAEGRDAGRMGRLVKEYGAQAFQFAYRLTGNVEESRELVQEAYRRIFERWEQYDPSQALESWFFSILHHLFLDAKRRYDVSHVISLDAPASEDRGEEFSYADSLPDHEDDVLTVLEREESTQAINQAFEQISCEHRAILTMCDINGMGYHEIAKVLGAPVGTVRSRICRARRALKRCLLKDQGALNYNSEEIRI